MGTGGANRAEVVASGGSTAVAQETQAITSENTRKNIEIPFTHHLHGNQPSLPGLID